MSASTIRNALGLLQDDPDHARAYQDLRDALGSGQAIADMSREQLAKLLEAARTAHASRLEYDAVASLLELEVVQAQGTDREVALLLELARVADEHLFDAGRAGEIYARVLTLDAGNAQAEDALETAVAKRAKWAELVKRYGDEAESASEPALKSSLLVSAAETAYRYGRPSIAGEKGAKKKLAALIADASTRLDEAVSIDPANVRAAALLEHIYRETKRWADLAALLEKAAGDVPTKDAKIAALLRLARVCKKKLEETDRAAVAYERVLDLAPENSEATSFLVDHFTAKQMWDHLVAVYQEQLGAATRAGREDAGTALQIAMIHWKMRASLDAAEPFFERVRKVEPAHAGMLAFFREHLGARGDTQRLTQILTEAQRAMPEGPARAQVGADIAKLAEDGANATKAIEQWRVILRQDAGNKDARDALKRLYRQSANHASLADLLRGDLERLAADDVAGRLVVLRELSAIYQGQLKNDTALVGVLSQIVTLDTTDADAARALARIYEALGRFRDLLTTQARLAELEREPSVRAELYRQIARRWLEQFTNVQNAVEAYERLLDAAPTDSEARQKLRELYVKRRAYKSLYELIEREVATSEGADRLEKWLEMAKLAAERLDRGPDAVRLYKLVLAEDPGAAAALDALEKQAERDKDFATVAEVIERRVSATDDPAAKAALLQKLGALYTERLQNQEASLGAWRRVIEVQPAHPKAVRVLRESYLAVGDYDGLTSLYAANSDWEGLAEVLSTAADKVNDSAAKVDLSFRAAAVYIEKIASPERAFRAYERVLGVRPDDERAAAALVPIYEADEKWARLPALYEVLCGHAVAVDAKLVWLDKLFGVTGKHLQDRVAAFRYARRAYDLAPARLSAFEKAAIESGEWTSFVEALGLRLAAADSPEDERRTIRAKVAETYATQLGRLDEAVATYKTLVEQDPTDEVSVQTLDRILRSSDRRDDLRWLFAQRVSVANTARKLETLEEWAALEEDVFGAPADSAALYRRILEVVPNHGRALRALSRLLSAAGEPEEAATLLERDRDQREGKERAAREIDLAKLYSGALERHDAALSAVERALQLAPGDRDAIAVLEQLMARAETRRGAAERLERAYAESGDQARQAGVVEVLLSTTDSPEARAALFDTLAGLREALGEPSTAFDVLVRAAAESPALLSVWDRLAELAARTQRAQALADALAGVVAGGGLAPELEVELSERAAALFDELGESDRARPYLARVLALDPTNERAFARLKQILTGSENWTDLEALYEAAIGVSDSGRRVELLIELAVVAEEITSDTDKAISCYERIIATQAGHPLASRALDTLYTMEARWADLAALLERRVDGAPGDEAAPLRVRLASLFVGKLDSAPRALEQLALVLEADPGAKDARELVEQVLGVAAHRQAAAAILESVYSASNSQRDLVRILEVRLEGEATTEGKIELLRRIAELRDEGLSEEVAALDAFARLVPIAPDDVHARTRLLDLARRVGSQAQAADVLEASAKAARVPQPRGEILMELARVREDLLGDSDKAEVAYREVLALDPADAALSLPAARALGRIYAAAGKSRELVEVLRKEVALEDGAEARRELFGRIGELCENALDDPNGAIVSWKARLEDDPTDDAGLAALDRLYERTGDHKALVEVLRSREQNATDPESRKRLLLRLAQTLADKLSDVTEAIGAYRALQDEFGADRALLGALAMLYEIADRHDDLADALEADLSMADATEDRLALLVRLGSVRQSKLKDVSAALETYRQALTLDSSHVPSRAALEALLSDDGAQRDAAGILKPLYEADGDHAKLLKVLAIEIGLADSVGERLDLLSQAVVVAEQSLGDPAGAFAFAARAVKEAAGEGELTAWMERAERLASAAKLEADFVSLLRGIVPDVLDEAAQVDVMLKVASHARTHLADAALAREYYEKALQVRGDEPRALEALESLYSAAGDFAALSDILQRLAEVAVSDAERKGFLLKQARVAEDSTADFKFAIEVYEQVLELGTDAVVIEALERLYARTERFDDMVALYERQLGEGADDDKLASLHARLGAVYRNNLADVDRAFDSYEAALKHDSENAEAIAALEALMRADASAGRAAEILEPVYLARLDWRRVMDAISARLRASQDPDDRRTLLKRLIKLHEEQEENYGAALDDAGRLLAEDVSDESTWSELERLARVANAPRRLAEIFAAELVKVSVDETATAQLCARTAELFEEQGESAQALVFYRRAYAFSPEDHAPVFGAVDRLLTAGGRHAERVALYRAALEFQNDDSARAEMLHTIARLEEVELHDAAAAMETYRAALEIDDSDAVSLDALSRLYGNAERFRDLADLIRRRAEQSGMPEEEARFRFDLGELLQHRLDDPSGAIDEFHAVVDLAAPGTAGSEQAVKALEALLREPDHKARVIEILRPIFERSDDWRRLLALDQQRLAITTDAGERGAIFKEAARIWEERGADSSRAFEAMRDAFVLDPEDGDARSELDRLCGVVGRWDDLADAYEQGLSLALDLTKRDLLSALAQLHDARRDDPRKALDAYGRLFALDESEPEPLEHMDALATLLADWPTVVTVLVKKAELTLDDSERASIWRRVGEARRDMLEDNPGALEAYESALELEPDSAWTIDNLLPLHEAMNNDARLVELYRRRVELAGDDEAELKYQLLVAAADRHEQALSNRAEAIALLGEALAVQPGDGPVTERLGRLYRSESMWPELLDNLKLQAAAASDEQRGAVKKAIGALLVSELGDPRQALDAYRDVLDAGFDDEAARAIRAIGEGSDELREEAADALEPALRASGNHAELVDVLELRLRGQEDPDARCRTLRAIASISESSLGDHARALDALVRAIADSTDDAELHGEIMRLCDRVAGAGYARYADALTQRAASVVDPQICADLNVRLGRVCEEHLKDDPRAAAAYARATEYGGDTSPTLLALDALYVRMGDVRALSDVLERRITLEGTPAIQADLYHRLAVIQRGEFGDKALALSTLRLALERSPDHAASRAAIVGLLDDDALFAEAFDALEGVYRSLGNATDLANLFERRVARASDRREGVRARLELARVVEDLVGDGARAQRIVEAALVADVTEPDVLAELERLAPATGGWREAADALASALRAQHDDVPSSARAELWSRIAGWRRDKLGDAAGAEEAFGQARAADPDNVDVLSAIEELQRQPGRERELIETLRARAKLDGDLSSRRTTLREAKAIAETTLLDPQLAESLVRELLTEDAADAWALEELTRMREAAGAWGEVAALLLRRVDVEADGLAIAALRHRAGEVYAAQLGDAERAIAIYRELFEADPNDAKATQALRGLYGATNNTRALSELLETLVDMADGEAARAALRIELAKLQDSRGETREATDTLRAILDENPTNSEAVIALSQLFEKHGQDDELAELLSVQLGQAQDRGDGVAELALQVRLAEVYESRLNDTPRALAAYEAVLVRDPSHRGALEAVARLGELRGAWDRASAALSKLLELATDASGVPVALRLAKAFGALDDDAGVASALRRALELEKSNEVVRDALRSLYEKRKSWSELAEMLVSDADLAEDAAGAEKSPAVVAGVVKSLRRASEIYSGELSAPGLAVPHLERASALAPADRELLLALCDVYTTSGRERAATEVLEKIIASFGGKRSKELGVFHHKLGRALASLGEKEAALAQFDLAFKIDPGAIGVLRELGVFSLESGDLERAQKTFRALLLQKLDDKSGITKAEVFFYLGEVLLKQGDKVKALPMYERAIENDASLATAKARIAELKG